MRSSAALLLLLVVAVASAVHIVRPDDDDDDDAHNGSDVVISQLPCAIPNNGCRYRLTTAYLSLPKRTRCSLLLCGPLLLLPLLLWSLYVAFAVQVRALSGLLERPLTLVAAAVVPSSLRVPLVLLRIASFLSAGHDAARLPASIPYAYLSLLLACVQAQASPALSLALGNAVLAANAASAFRLWWQRPQRIAVWRGLILMLALLAYPSTLATVLCAAAALAVI